jgi:hypothetical protein
MRSLIPAGACALGLAALLVAGCGGGSSHPAETVRADAFSYQAPWGWQISRRDTEVAASPKPGSPERVSVAVFPLLHPYQPRLFPAVTKELDASAAEEARQLKGYVRKRVTTTVAGSRVRQYLLYASNPDFKSFTNVQITYFLRRKTEFELLCQWQAGKSEPDYCKTLTATFRPT